MDEIIEGHIKFEGREPVPVNNVWDILPENVFTFHEPFIESSFLLLDSIVEEKTISGIGYHCYSFDSLLIKMWMLIKDNWRTLLAEYESRFLYMSSIGTEGEKISWIKSMVDSVNDTNPSVHDFFFLWWSHFGRMNIYGKDAETYVFSHHLVLENSGLASVIQKLTPISQAIRQKDVNFINITNVSEIVPEREGDFVFCDPLFDRGNDDFQFGTISDIQYFDWLRTLNCNYIFTFPPKIDQNNIELDVPSDIYRKVYLLKELRNIGFEKGTGKGFKSEYYFIK